MRDSRDHLARLALPDGVGEAMPVDGNYGWHSPTPRRESRETVTAGRLQGAGLKGVRLPIVFAVARRRAYNPVHARIIGRSDGSHVWVFTA